MTLLRNNVNVLDEDMKETTEDVRQVDHKAEGLGEDFQGFVKRYTTIVVMFARFLLPFVPFPCFLDWIRIPMHPEMLVLIHKATRQLQEYPLHGRSNRHALSIESKSSAS